MSQEDEIQIQKPKFMEKWKIRLRTKPEEMIQNLYMYGLMTAVMLLVSTYLEQYRLITHIVSGTMWTMLTITYIKWHIENKKKEE